jgi:photosystem II stability/assembly factor-like uncharacterized protein
MKKYFILSGFLFFLNVNLFAVDYWIKVPTPTTKRFHRVAIIDSLNIFAVGDSSILLKTTNGGLNWIPYQLPQLFLLNSISFPSKNIGWIIANDNIGFTGSSILYTSNSGLNWNITRFWDSTETMTSIFFADTLIGWMAGFQGKIFKTTNGGFNWNAEHIDQSICSGFPIFRIRSYDKNLVYSAGGAMDMNGVSWTYFTNLNSWKSSCVSPEPVWDIHVFDSLNAICSGGDLEFGVIMIETKNGGRDWIYKPLNIFGMGESISFRTRNEGWMVTGFSARFAYTIDTAKTWSYFSTQDTAAMYDIKFINQRIGWAAGDKGCIYKYNTGIIGIYNESTIVPDIFTLYQNYPNPFNNSTIIKFDLSEGMDVKVKIFDINGKLVNILIDGFKEKGYHSILFSNDNLASGLYFYEISALKNNKIHFSKSKKMLIIK